MLVTAPLNLDVTIAAEPFISALAKSVITGLPDALVYEVQI